MIIERAALRRLAHARDLLVRGTDDLAAIARAAGMSRFHFIRQFAAVFGATPHQLRIDARIARAKALLADGASVTDACFAVGAASLGSFSALFARRVGVPPSAYRRAQIAVPRPPIHCFALLGSLPPGAFRNSGEAPRAGSREARAST